MKFLIDRCVGQKLAVWLRTNGHDAVEARVLFDPDPGDRALLDYAAKDKRIVITIDVDFGYLVFAGQAEHAGLIRLPDVPSDKRITIVEQLLAKHGKEIESGAIATVRGGRIRISRTPKV